MLHRHASAAILYFGCLPGLKYSCGAGLSVSAVGLQPARVVQLDVLGPIQLAQKEADTLQVHPWTLGAASISLRKASMSPH